MVTWRAVLRLLQVVAVGLRYLVPAALAGGGRPRLAGAASQASRRLGATYQKFGQVLASSPGLVGAEVADAFRSCLDTGPPLPVETVRQATAAPGAYRSVDPRPLGTASIAVVHRAVLSDGTPVAIKIRRPGVATIVDADLRILRAGLGAAVRLGGSADAAQLLDVLDDFARNLREELDLDRERAAMERMGRRLAERGFARIVVPRTHPGLSDERVLVMELLDGIAVDDLDGIAALGVDPGPLIDEVIRAWLATSLLDGEFHGDAHAGNVLVLRDGRIGLIDWGIVGRLDDAGRRCTLALLEGAAGRAEAWDVVAEHFLAALGPALLVEIGTTTEALPRVLRDLLGPMLTAPLGRTSLGEFLERARALSEAAARKAGTEAMTATRDGAGADDAFVQGFFLWTKQLVFFERYARLHRRTLSVVGHAAPLLPPRPGGRGPDVDGLHHVTVVVEDLEAAIRGYRRLGFQLSPPTCPALPDAGGALLPFGAANTHAHLAGGFVELVACAGRGAPLPADVELVALEVRPEHRERFVELVQRTLDELGACLERFEGAHRVVFRSPDLYAAAQRLSGLGVGHSGVQVTDRTVDGVRETVRFLELDRDELGEPGMPEGILAVASALSERPVQHPNGAAALTEVVLAVPDAQLAATARRYEAYLGRLSEVEGPTRVVPLGGGRVVLVGASALPAVVPGSSPLALPAFVAVGFVTSALETTRRWLAQSGVPYVERDEAVVVAPAHAMGVTLAFRTSSRGIALEGQPPDLASSNSDE